jgi:hypothetical protein
VHRARHVRMPAVVVVAGWYDVGMHSVELLAEAYRPLLLAFASRVDEPTGCRSPLSPTEREALGPAADRFPLFG